MDVTTIRESGHSMIGPIVINDECQVMLPVGWTVEKLAEVYEVATS